MRCHGGRFEPENGAGWLSRLPRAALALAIAVLFSVIGLVLIAPKPAAAAELIMVETRGCPWCLLWHREIGPAYPKTEQGRRAPLRTVDIKQLPSLGIDLAAPVKMAPTFVLVDGGREIGRIDGYPGADFFWGLLDALIARLEPSSSCETACTRQTMLGDRLPVIGLSAADRRQAARS